MTPSPNPDPRLARECSSACWGRSGPSELLRALSKPWPKLFQNLRSSRETELLKQFPVNVVCAWLGNTPKVAIKHYAQVTDDDFRQANGGGPGRQAG